MISAFTQNCFGMDMPAWNARACIHGPPLQVTLEPCFVSSDLMWFKNAMGVSAISNPQHSSTKMSTNVNDGEMESEKESQPPKGPQGMTHAYSIPSSSSSGAAKQQPSSLFSRMMSASSSNEHQDNVPQAIGRKRSILDNNAIDDPHANNSMSEEQHDSSVLLDKKNSQNAAKKKKVTGSTE